MCWVIRHTVWSQRPDACRALVTATQEHADDGENKELINREQREGCQQKLSKGDSQIKGQNLP